MDNAKILKKRDNFNRIIQDIISNTESDSSDISTNQSN